MISRPLFSPNTIAEPCITRFHHDHDMLRYEQVVVPLARFD